MSSEHQERFDLSEFVLGYLEEVGSVIMPPAFGVHDILMPEEIAAQLALSEESRVAFSSHVEGEPADDALRLSVNHPVVETIARTITRQPANALAYVSGIRIDKRGLAELAQKHFALPNARLDALPKSQEEGKQHHYLFGNFKVTFVSEEKQEELRTVVMDVQAGHAVTDPTLLRRLEVIDGEPFYADLPIAQPRWGKAGLEAKAEDVTTLSSDALQALLPRAEQELRRQLTEHVGALTLRMERHLTLDLARINDYYDEMAADLQKRQARTSEEGGERQQNFADKIAALEAERAAKLQDANGRYRMRVEMTLINVLLVSQAKVVLPVVISNRTATIRRTVVWDPLLHRLEPLVCDVCGQPGEALHLCTSGHLAHEKCLAPQCIDCKRAFCQLCANQIGECVVCHRPVCKPSLVKCPTCGRGTCSEHQQLCHAAEGQPVTLPEVRLSPAPAQLPPAKLPRAKSTTPAAKPLAGKVSPTKVAPTQPKLKLSSPPPATSATPIVKGVRIAVEIKEKEDSIVAFVMRSTNRALATRSFELTPKGILIHCDCEKSPCPADSYYHRPAPATGIQEQIEGHLRKLQQEYLIPAKKVKYYYQDGIQFEEVKRLRLPARWRDPIRLIEATQGFDAMAGHR